MAILNEMEDNAVRLLDEGKLRRSEQVLKRMLVADRNCIAAHFHLARVYRRTREYDLALCHGRRTLRISPNERNACLNLGLIYDLLGRDARAIFYYKKELSRNPASPETLWNLGRLYFRKRRWLLASTYLQRCFDLGYTFEIEDTAYKLSICYYERQDFDSYVDLFSRYIQIFPKAGWAFANLGRALLYEKKDFRKAFLRLLRAKKLGIRTVDKELIRAKEMAIKSN